jgi:hypothetical protein
MGHNMRWWATLARRQILDYDSELRTPDNLLHRLGIQDAVLAGVREEAAWKKRRGRRTA